MPYIKPIARPEFDPIVDLMVKLGVKVNGDLNYILFKFCKYHITPSYNNYKNYIGELTECGAEIRREILGPYEDQKKAENGEV